MGPPRNFDGSSPRDRSLVTKRPHRIDARRAPRRQVARQRARPGTARPRPIHRSPHRWARSRRAACGRIRLDAAASTRPSTRPATASTSACRTTMPTTSLRAWRRARGGCRSRACAATRRASARRRCRWRPAAPQSPRRGRGGAGRRAAAPRRSRRSCSIVRTRNIGSSGSRLDERRAQRLERHQVAAASDADRHEAHRNLRVREIDRRPDGEHRPEVVHVARDADDRAADVGAALSHPRAERELVAKRAFARPQPSRPPSR